MGCGERGEIKMGQDDTRDAKHTVIYLKKFMLCLYGKDIFHPVPIRRDAT